jgi:hypothetical protein
MTKGDNNFNIEKKTEENNNDLEPLRSKSIKSYTAKEIDMTNANYGTDYKYNKNIFNEKL